MALGSPKIIAQAASMQLSTRRFLLRDFTDEDAVAFVAYQSDPRYLALTRREYPEPDAGLDLTRLFASWAS
jgi:RimJ/RimL family protein N-acetyltransferase